MKRRIGCLLLVAAMLITLLAPTISAAGALPFEDVSASSWYYSAVKTVYENGIMQGQKKTIFAPNAWMTRAELVTILARLAKAEVAGMGEAAAAYDDIAGKEWHAACVGWAASVGIVKGYTDHTFRPNQHITRQELAAMFHRFLDYIELEITYDSPIASFADSGSIPRWAQADVEVMRRTGLMRGDNKGNFNPLAGAMRSEVATVAARLVGYMSEEIPCTHDYQAEVTVPTCLTAGFTTYRCTICGDQYTDAAAAALGHTWDSGKVTKNATEEAEGETTYTCTRCGTTRVEPIPKLNHTHNYTAVVTAPTCTAAGYTTHTCACGDQYTDAAAAALGHTWDSGKVTKNVTEEAEGETTYTCTRCGTTRVEPIPMLDHTHAYVVTVIAPTCTEQGSTTYACACGARYVDNYLEPLGHSYEDGVCTRCGQAQPTAASFRIETAVADGYRYDAAANTYTIVAAGEYSCYGTLEEGQLIVDAPDTDAVVINLSGCTISSSTASPLCILNADEVDISAKKNTRNYVYDRRPLGETDEETTVGTAAIYSQCDLTLKGNGALTVESTYNNGIHSKDDLKIKNETLTVKAVNNAIKGNDSVTIESGTIVAISTGGDAIKTNATDRNKKGEQRGVVDIQSGKVTLYAACDGIDSASDVLISGDAVVDIFTDKYSPYSGDVMVSSNAMLYLRISSTIHNVGYRYSAYYYNADGTGRWEDVTFFKSVAASTSPGRPGGGFPGMGGFPGSSSTYYYYSVPKPSGYTSVRFYAYTSTQTPGQSETYYAVSNTDTTIPTAKDTFVVSAISGGTINTSGWTNYQSSSGNTGLDYSCKGIKADNTIIISGGTIQIQSTDDGLHANFDYVMESTGQKGLGNIEITGGSLTVTSADDAIHADQDLRISGGTTQVITAYEGLEANRIYISGGDITAYATDDGVNANSKGAYSGYIEISGGKVDVAVPSGDTDTLDSNGSILLSGGFILLKNGQMSGSSMGGGTLDADCGVTVTGGTVIAIGCIGEKMANAVSSTSQTFAAGAYTIRTSGGEVFASFELASSYRAYMFWSDAFVSGETYTVYQGEKALFQFK